MKSTVKDLFEDYENIPENIQAIMDKYETQENDYPVLENMRQEMIEQGYVFEYGLDAEPYALRKIGVSINSIEGFEDHQ